MAEFAPEPDAEPEPEAYGMVVWLAKNSSKPSEMLNSSLERFPKLRSASAELNDIRNASGPPDGSSDQSGWPGDDVCRDRGPSRKPVEEVEGEEKVLDLT